MKYIFAFLSCFTSNVNGSQEVNYEELHKPYFSLNCLSEKTQQDMDKCGDRNLLTAKKTMESMVETIHTRFAELSPELSGKFKKSQTLWEESHTIECQLEAYDSIEGSGYHSILSSCIEMKMNERISYLRWLASGI
ncbi:lysozyme inhibitor LprI family protein [Pseudoalteromonas sp. bablab_jr010]|uniref:lysozyme inhibitor LprI family protein n=1 Tax=Pseudoalteromonas sp. bablab_jr010 TaxID=2755063 RepID=UPI0018F32F03|nr:lysozyme inhibitor LprI family protein [Pseudoalteromonas sp. bablab_jr010]